MQQQLLDEIGQPLDRVDGRLKITGAAKYSGDIFPVRLAYGLLITSSIAKGRIVSIDMSSAMQTAGVIAILTPFNAPRLAKGSYEAQKAAATGASQPGAAAQPGPSGQKANTPATKSGPADRVIHLLQETDVFYNGQPIGVVIAEAPEAAAEAASRILVKYQEERPMLQMKREFRRAYRPKSAGGQQVSPEAHHADAERAWQAADHKFEATYTTPAETHNALEPHCTVAIWSGDILTLYDATQGIFTDRKRISGLFDLPPENVHIISHFVGGGFGSKGPVWSHVALAALAARHVQRPVRLELARNQMFGTVGFRGETYQTLRLGAKSDGSLTTVKHDGIVQTSSFDEFIEPVGANTKMLYASPHISTSYLAVRLNTGTPSYTRAPGEASGTFALECAMDELAYQTGLDPVELRLRNYADTDPESGNPWSSKSLKECYRVGADVFGWNMRAKQPGATRDSKTGELIGLGMATASYPARRSASTAMARILADGTATVQCGTQDIGTGTYTVMTQVAAEALGLDPGKVRFKLGDTDLPEGAHSGGSQTAASVGSAVLLACNALRDKLAALAVGDKGSPLYHLNSSDLVSINGGLQSKLYPSRRDAYSRLLLRNGLPKVDATVEAKPGDEQQKFAMHSFGAHFAQVRVDPDFGSVRVSRYAGAFAAGRILNAKTARNQFLGGITWGISMALFEETQLDPHTGRVINADLAEYYVPVNADVPDISVHFVEEQDSNVNPIGVKGIGELGIVGAAAAVANAVYHATGKRVRELPITLDKLI